MTDIRTSFQKIVREFKRLQEPGAPEISFEAFSGWVSDDSGGQVTLSKAIDKEIRVVAAWMREQRPATKSQHKLKEWQALVRNAFGPALTSLDRNESDVDSGRKLKKIIEAAIDLAPNAASSRFITVGCTLFDEPLPAPLQIGSVLFQTKGDWLVHAEMTNQITPKVRQRLARAFAGRRLAKPKDAWQAHNERSILRVLQSASHVCTVETRNLAPAMAETRGIIGARLAHTALALLWRTPSSALEGFHLSTDPGYRTVRTIVFIPGSKHVAGGSRSVGSSHGPNVRPRSLSEFLAQARDLLDVAGRVIETWTSVNAYDNAPPILRNFAQALFFFSEGCREENDLMAIVKFTAALEALSQGKSAKIKELMNARVPFKKNVKIYADKDVDDVVDWLYSKHRSRTLHGTNPEILHDWSDARGLGESMTRLCLVYCMDWFHSHPTATNGSDLLQP